MASLPLSWQGIANTQGDTAEFRVWLTRNKDNTNKNNHQQEPWHPLRHVDCTALRRQVATLDGPRPVHIEGGRATADPVANLVFDNFVRGPQRSLCDAVWFVRDQKEGGSNKKDHAAGTLWPVVNRDDEDKMESLYKNAVILLNEGVENIGDACPSVTLSNQATVRVVQQGRHIFLRQTAAGWFGNTQMLQRGYGPYTVEGEADEVALGPVTSLVFIIHGIGEKYFTRETQTHLPSLLEQTGQTRRALYKHQAAAHARACEAAVKAGTEPPSKPGRIELLPIEWFDALHNEQSDVIKNLQAVTLPSIPALRAIANDIVFDVLVYLTPNFCQAVLQRVTQQLSTLYQAFGKVHASFDGPVSIMGHSLGSVIVWDLLSLQKDQRQQQQQQTDATTTVRAKPSPWGPSLPDNGQVATLPFAVHTAIFLGSPLGMFLSLRGAHKAFDEMRLQDDAAAVVSPFTLPVQRLVNIFNASDPVAYRIEPLLIAPETTSQLPPPEYLTAPGKDLRLHVKARQLGDTVRKSLLESSTSTWSAVLGAVAAGVEMSQSLEKKKSSNDNMNNNADDDTDNKRHVKVWKFPLGGSSDRVDYAFQPALVDNEYISAVLAHSTTGYLLNMDFLEYLVHHLG